MINREKHTFHGIFEKNFYACTITIKLGKQWYYETDLNIFHACTAKVCFWEKRSKGKEVLGKCIIHYSIVCE